jgi:hypothetical protein
LIGVVLVVPENLEIKIDVIHIVEGKVFPRFIADEFPQVGFFHLRQGDFLDDDGTSGKGGDDSFSLASGIAEKFFDACGESGCILQNTVHDDSRRHGNLSKPVKNIAMGRVDDFGKLQRIEPMSRAQLFCSVNIFYVH